MSDERLPEEGEELIDGFDLDEEDPGEIEAAEEEESPEEIEDNRQQEDENARLRAENERLKAAMQQPQLTHAQQVQAHLAALDQFEQLSYEQKQQVIAQNYQRQALMQADQADHAYFQNKLAEERLPKRYATQVEQVLQQARQQNMNPSREMCLNAILGHELRTRRTGGARQAPASGGRGRDRSGRGEFTAEDERLLKSATWADANR